jgi:anti-anti-sigma factor
VSGPRLRVEPGEGAGSVRLVGELDISTVDSAAQALSAVFRDATTVAIDLSDLTFIDSSGVRLLLAALRDQRARGGDVVLQSPTENVRHVFDILGLEANGVVITPPRDQAS